MLCAPAKVVDAATAIREGGRTCTCAVAVWTPNDRLAVRGRRTGERVSTVAVALYAPKVRLAVIAIRTAVLTITATPAECDWNAPVAVMEYRAGERRCTRAVDVCPSKVRLAAIGIRETVRDPYQYGRCMAAKGTAGSYGDTGGFTYPHLARLPYARQMHRWR